MKRDRWEVGPAGASAPRAWRIRRNRKVWSYCDTQQDGIRLAVWLCRKHWSEQRIPAELVIKGRNAQVRDARTYGADPRGVKG